MNDGQADNAELRRKIMGFMVSQAICAVSELGVPDHLAAGPLAVRDLADAVRADPDALARFLRVLAAEGLFTEQEPGVFALATLGRLLRTEVPGSLRHFAALMSDEAYTVWGAAAHAVRTGEPAFEHVFGLPYFGWLAENPDAAARFNAAQAGLVELRLLPLLEWNWAGVRAVVDVGGGNGLLLARLLERHPHLRGIVFDLPQVMSEAAKETWAATGVARRVEGVAGDFFAGVPEGADVYVLSQILHDWNDERAAAILRRCHHAVPAHGRVLVLEQVLDEVREPDPAALLDLHMLVLLGGRERTATGWAELLSRSGFSLGGIRYGPRSALIEAIPV
ncbi:MAG: methyltransferase [Pseudonocardiaceae bacterium]